MPAPHLRVNRRLRGLALVAGMLLAAARVQSAGVIMDYPKDAPDVAGFKTPATAQTMRIDGLRRLTTGKMGFLGVLSDTNADGKVIVAAIAPNSPAFKAGVKTNDVIARFDGEAVTSLEALKSLIETNAPGRTAKVTVLRGAETVELTVKLASLGEVGRPMDRVRLGVQGSAVFAHGGYSVEAVDAESAGAQAGIKPGDFIRAINGVKLDGSKSLSEALADAPVTVSVPITVLRGDDEVHLEARLAAPDAPDRPVSSFGFRGYGVRGFGGRTKADALRVAIIGVEFPDAKHNPRVTTKNWEQAFFSTNSYSGRTATGSTAYGSINDYYLEQSSGGMRVEGKMFDWIELSKNRMEYATNAIGARAGAGAVLLNGIPWTGQDDKFLEETLNKLAAREGERALAGFDAVVFLYAGRSATTVQTNLFWPHSTSVLSQGRRLRYVVTAEGGERMSDISIICHELGHVLGLPDLYLRTAEKPATPSPGTGTNAVAASVPRNSPFGRTTNPYAESVANWDLMAIQVGFGRPQHLGAWSKEQLGWVKPAVVDPTVRQKLVLGPIEKATNECFKIPLRPDGSEYLLLENRRRIGFDQSVPAEGLLIWRVVYGRPVLEEAHGITGPNAARIDLRDIPFPAGRNDSFTPYSKPSSVALTGDELPVYLTNIRRLPDGRISFYVGYGYD